MKTITFSLRFQVETDWHIGSGLEQPGGNDRLVRRDRFGLPFIPGKTITGMIRDAAETLAMGIAAGERPHHDGESPDTRLAELKQDIWYRWVLWLFGDQPNRVGDRLEHRTLHPSQISVRPAFLPDSLRLKIGVTRGHADNRSVDTPDRAELRRALFFSRPGVKIGLNGRSEDQHLRQDEMVRRSLTLRTPPCTIQLPSDEASELFAWNFLQLAVASVEKIGAKRRRGAGKVKVIVESTETLSNEELADYFEQLPAPPNLPKTSIDRLQPIGSAVAPVDKENNSAWIRIPYQLTLKTPLLVSQRTVGNVVRSFDHVPGTMLLPVLSRTFGKAIGSEIVTGNLRAMPACPVVTNKGGITAGVHVPTCIAHPKGEGAWFETSGDVSNRMTESNDDHVKTFRSGFIGMTGDTLPTFTTTPIVVNPHNTIEEQHQRPTTEVGGVFSYEAIESGTKLAGEFRIRKHTQEALNPDWTKLNGQISLGRSRKDDYGLADITVMPPEPVSVTNSANTGTDADELTIWLTSDAILRDRNLRFSPVVDTLRDVIAKSIGVDSADLSVDEKHAYLRQRRIESWHVVWGLPRSTIVAIAAGSCVRFRRNGGKALAADALSKLQMEGIGERKSEGYGAVLVNHPLLETQFNALPPAETGTPALPEDEFAAVPDKELARNLERCVWQNRIRQQALHVAVEGHRKSDHPLNLTDSQPGGAQAGLLRNLLRMPLETSTNRDDVAKRVKRLQDMRADKWPDQTLSVVHRLLKDGDAVWEILNPGDWPTLAPDSTKELKAELLPEAIQVLILTCLKVQQRQREKKRTPAAMQETGAN